MRKEDIVKKNEFSEDFINICIKGKIYEELQHRNFLPEKTDSLDQTLFRVQVLLFADNLFK